MCVRHMLRNFVATLLHPLLMGSGERCAKPLRDAAAACRRQSLLRREQTQRLSATLHLASITETLIVLLARRRKTLLSVQQQGTTVCCRTMFDHTQPLCTWPQLLGAA
jgi:hypothetical protein